MKHKSLVRTPHSNKRFGAVRLHICRPDKQGDVYVQLGNESRWVASPDLPGIAWAFLKAWMRSKFTR